MKTDIFQLQIIPLNKIKAQERFDESRARGLSERLKKEKILKNPLIVANLYGDNFVQLDGMNRLSAFKMLGFDSIVCQIVDYQDMDNVELGSWIHLFNAKQPDFLSTIAKIKGLNINQGKMDQVKNRYIQSLGPDRISVIVTLNYQISTVTAGGVLLDKVNRINEIVNAYDNIVRDVLPQRSKKEDIKFLFNEHTDCNIMTVFPTFTRHQIIKVVNSGGLFPPGITRHIIKRRCMNLNLPLSFFADKSSVRKKNEFLEKIVFKRKFRVYEEPTVYFE